jgi:hypothetical protein
MDTDKWSYFPATTPDPIGKYVQPKEYAQDMGGVENTGYPTNVVNTQTVKTRGCGACTKGASHSKNSQ